MGRAYRTTNTFNENDSNTICDVTGFLVKRSEVLKRWEGFWVLPAAWHPRQNQDYPPKIVKQTVYKDVRTEQVEADGAVAAPEVI